MTDLDFYIHVADSTQTRLGGLHDEVFVEVLSKAIIGSAKRLCYTSYGNCLCQQLVERGNAENKSKFITEIK